MEGKTMSGAIGRLGGKLRRARMRPTALRGSELAPFTNGWLSGIIQAQDQIEEEGRVKDGYIHVSSLLNFCPRAAYLINEQDVQDVRSVRSGDRVMWAIGRSLEAHMRKQFFQAHKHQMFGNWSCSCGSTTHQGNWVDRTCGKCGVGADTYGELKLVDDDLMLTGSPDLIISHDDRQRVVECKSINKREFEGLSKPKPDHVFQLNHYVRMLGQDAHDENIVIYICKDFQWASPYKEFVIKRGEQKAAIDLSIQQLRDYRRARTDGVRPPRLAACGSPTTSAAKGCSACVNCFNCD